MIILTSEQVGQLQVPTLPWIKLDPVQTKSGAYALPESVLDDPLQNDNHDFLALLPTSALSASDFNQVLDQ